MNVLTEYYKMEHRSESTSQTRVDCVEHTGCYEMFEDIAKRSRDGKLHLFIANPQKYQTPAQTIAGCSITNGKHITSVEIPDFRHALDGYGDINGTEDAVLVRFTSLRGFEMYIARGEKARARKLCALLSRGRLDKDIRRLKAQAQPPTLPHNPENDMRQLLFAFEEEESPDGGHR